MFPCISLLMSTDFNDSLWNVIWSLLQISIWLKTLDALLSARRGPDVRINWVSVTVINIIHRIVKYFDRRLTWRGSFSLTSGLALCCLRSQPRPLARGRSVILLYWNSYQQLCYLEENTRWCPPASLHAIIMYERKWWPIILHINCSLLALSEYKGTKWWITFRRYYSYVFFY